MHSKIMRRIAAPLGLALIGALGACGPVNRGLESVNQPIVNRADYTLDVGVTPGGLAAGEDVRLAGWFDSLRLGYGDRISVDDPSPYGHPGTRDAVAAVAAHYGLLVGTDAPVTQGAVSPDMVRIVVSRSSARMDRCPDWRRKSQPEFASSTMSNYGCAVNANLAAMVANPEDLVHGRSSGLGSDARVASKAITTYRDAEATGKAGLKAESASSAGGK